MVTMIARAVGKIQEQDRVKIKLPSFATAFSALLCCFYAVLFYRDIQPYWFHPEWTTDDALQQWFPLHVVFHPEIFKGDFITETMAGYLAPVHYWLAYLLTAITGGPLMAAHWVMFVQIAGTVVFLFLTVRLLAGNPAAFLAVAWLLHTRPLMQRITGGLPRGWAPVVLAMSLYFMIRGKPKAVLIALFVGCLTNPPATMIAALTWGLYLTLGVIKKETRSRFKQPFLTLLFLSPLYLATVYYVIDRPAEVGEMASYETASTMPEFQRPHGRFPFVPLEAVSKEIRMYAYQPFGHRLYNPGRTVKRAMPWLVLAGILFFYGLGIVRRRQVVHPVLTVLFVSIVSVYFLSRLLAFKLYVPDRHLQIPMAIFLIVFFSSAIWRGLQRHWPVAEDKLNLKKTYPAIIGTFILIAVVLVGTGDGLYGAANFNYSRFKKGSAFEWIRKYSEPEALVAGHPTHIDGLPLFGERRAFVTTETSHPFYPVYYAEMKRRLEISLKAHYAKNLKEIVDLLAPEGVDYFIFSRKRFYPEALKEEHFFSPLTPLVEDLTSRNFKDYAYKQIPRETDPDKTPYLMYRDEQSVIISVPLLMTYLAKGNF